MSTATAAMSPTAMETAAPMETTTSATMEPTAKAGLPAGRKAADISSVIKATERAGVRPLLSVGK